jgi:two-component system LytT family response regulator
MSSFGALPATRATPASEVRSRVDSLILRVDGTVRVVPLDDVAWIETEGNYLRFHAGAASLLARGSAAVLEAQLDPRHFARIHRRYFVNVRRVHEIRPLPSGDATVHLRDGTRLRLSRGHRERFFSRFLRDAG